MFWPYAFTQPADWKWLHNCQVQGELLGFHPPWSSLAWVICPLLLGWTLSPPFLLFSVIHHSGFPAASLTAPFQAVFVRSSSFLPTLEMLWFPGILRCAGILCLYSSLTETPNSRPVGCKLSCPCGQVMEINEDLGTKKKYHRNYTGVFKNWKEDVPWPSLRFHEGVEAILTSGSERSVCLPQVLGEAEWEKHPSSPGVDARSADLRSLTPQGVTPGQRILSMTRCSSLF